MLEFYGTKFLGALVKFSRATALMAGVLHVPAEEDTALLISSLKELTDAMREAPLSDVLHQQARRLQEMIDPNNPYPLGIEARLYLALELYNNLQTDLSSHLFLCVPGSRKEYYTAPQAWIPQKIGNTFPDAVPHLTDGGRCFALEQWTACVFHMMGALEFGLRAFANRLNVHFATGIELENWQNIIEQIEKEIRALQQKPKGIAKADEIQFYSDVAMHFWYIKGAWRNHVSHARKRYDEADALRILPHVCEFLESLA